nr:MAG TPA: hypothetical protein [Caudoviricetes sp.]
MFSFHNILRNVTVYVLERVTSLSPTAPRD